MQLSTEQQTAVNLDKGTIEARQSVYVLAGAVLPSGSWSATWSGTGHEHLRNLTYEGFVVSGPRAKQPRLPGSMVFGPNHRAKLRVIPDVFPAAHWTRTSAVELLYAPVRLLGESLEIRRQLIKAANNSMAQEAGGVNTLFMSVSNNVNQMTVRRNNHWISNYLDGRNGRMAGVGLNVGSAAQWCASTYGAAIMCQVARAAQELGHLPSPEELEVHIKSNSSDPLIDCCSLVISDLLTSDGNRAAYLASQLYSGMQRLNNQPIRVEQVDAPALSEIRARGTEQILTRGRIVESKAPKLKQIGGLQDFRL